MAGNHSTTPLLHQVWKNIETLLWNLVQWSKGICCERRKERQGLPNVCSSNVLQMIVLAFRWSMYLFLGGPPCFLSGNVMLAEPGEMQGDYTGNKFLACWTRERRKLDDTPRKCHVIDGVTNRIRWMYWLKIHTTSLHLHSKLLQ